MAQATVLSVTGNAVVVLADGSTRPLKAGDVIQKGETIRTAAGARVELMMEDGQVVAMGPSQSVRVDESMAQTEATPTTADAATQGGTVEQITQLLEQGGDLTQELEAAAAGAGGGGGGDGSDFVRLLRVAEGVDPLAYDYSFDPLAGPDEVLLSSEQVIEEPPVLAVLSLVGPESVVEGEAATYTLSVDVAPLTDLIVSIVTGHVTTQAGDYVPVIQTITIPAGQTSVTFDVQTNDDFEADNGEQYDVSIVSVGGGDYDELTVGVAKVVTTIQDQTGSDEPPGPEDTVTFKLFAVVTDPVTGAKSYVAANSVAEGSSATYIVKAYAGATDISASASGNVTVTFGDGTPDASTADYAHGTGTRSVAVGTEFTVAATDDYLADGGEKFTLSLTGGYTGTEFEAHAYEGTVTTTITDDDVTPLVVDKFVLSGATVTLTPAIYELGTKVGGNNEDPTSQFTKNTADKWLVSDNSWDELRLSSDGIEFVLEDTSGNRRDLASSEISPVNDSTFSFTVLNPVNFEFTGVNPDTLNFELYVKVGNNWVLDDTESYVSGQTAYSFNLSAGETYRIRWALDSNSGGASVEIQLDKATSDFYKISDETYSGNQVSGSVTSLIQRLGSGANTLYLTWNNQTISFAIQSDGNGGFVADLQGATSVTWTTSEGVLVFNDNGTYTFDPADSLPSQPLSISYELIDQGLQSDSGVMEIVVPVVSSGTAVSDLLVGGYADDSLSAGAGNDTLEGGGGKDTLSGGDGDDVLDGGVGNDILTGGLGVDVFKWSLGDQGLTGTPARDIVKDFNVGQGDVLDLEDLLQGENSGNLSNYLKFGTDSSTGKLMLSVDHDGGTAFDATQNIVLESYADKAALAGALGLSSTATDADILNKMLATGQLKIDQ